MIKYVNKIPSKIEYFEMVRTVSEVNKIDVCELTKELEETITAVCAYNGERLIGMGRIKKENNMLCIEDLIVNSEPYKEEIQNTIIVDLIKQINQMKLYNVVIRDCLELKDLENQEDIDIAEENDEDLHNGNQFVGA